jgi:hypothetical protein
MLFWRISITAEIGERFGAHEGGSDRCHPSNWKREERDMPAREGLPYSPWTGFAYAASAFRNMSETMGGLERKMRIKKVEPLAGLISPYKDSVPPCIPGWNCMMSVDRLEKTLAELEKTAKAAIELGRSMIAQARRSRVDEFEIRLSEPVGPAPDRWGAARRSPAPRPKPKRPKRRKPSPKGRAR